MAADLISKRFAANLLSDLAVYAKTGEIGPTLALLTTGHLEDILRDWAFWGRCEQRPPPGTWTSWLILGGRGAGKTRSGAEFVRAMALGHQPYSPVPVSPIALVGETYDEARAIMVEGASGVLGVHTSAERPDWKPARRMLEWANGARAYLHSAESHEALRGPEFAAAWLDEVAKWRTGEAAFDQLQFGLRAGKRPRQVITTTPRPVPLIRALLAREGKGVVVTRMATRANEDNLAPGFLSDVVGKYAGTRLGRQELDGEMIDDRPDTLFLRGVIDASRVPGPPDDLRRIVVAVDPPASSSAGADACGIIAAGADAHGNAYVLEDATAQGLSPAAWARRAIGLYRRRQADRIVAEVNQGGEMVEAVLRQVDPDVPVRRVRATRGKWLRAEPVAALYEQGRVRHAGTFAELEDEMADFGPDGLSDGRSPDRLDALVWAITALIGPADPKIRRV